MNEPLEHAREQLREEFEQLRGEIEELHAEEGGGDGPLSGGGFGKARASLAVLALTAAIAAAAGNFALNGGRTPKDGSVSIPPPSIEPEPGVITAGRGSAEPSSSLLSLIGPGLQTGILGSNASPPSTAPPGIGPSPLFVVAIRCLWAGTAAHEAGMSRAPARSASRPPRPRPCQSQSQTHLSSRSRRHQLRPAGPAAVRGAAAARATATVRGRRWPGSGEVPGDGGKPGGGNTAATRRTAPAAGARVSAKVTSRRTEKATRRQPRQGSREGSGRRRGRGKRPRRQRRRGGPSKRPRPREEPGRRCSCRSGGAGQPRFTPARTRFRLKRQFRQEREPRHRPR